MTVTTFKENAQVTSMLTYLIDQWELDGEMSKSEHRYYEKLIKTSSLSVKKALWHELTGSEFYLED